MPARPGRAALGVVQTVARTAPERPRALTILLDSSAGNRAAGPALIRALDAIPTGRSVGLVIAADAPVVVEPARWSKSHRDIIQAIADADIEGGQDYALTEALDIVPDWPTDLLWVHGHVPGRLARACRSYRKPPRRRRSKCGTLRRSLREGRAHRAALALPARLRGPPSAMILRRPSPASPGP